MFGGADAYRVAAEFTAAGNVAPKKINSITRMYGQLLKTKVQAHASGRPGPNAPTGEYRGEVNVVMEDETAHVGTNQPQGWRLEKGFFGTDSLGRTYNQPPYPHFGPAVDEIEGPYLRAIMGAIEI